jgi:hypothetical protein
MLPLDSDRWGEIAHAYGGASDIPELLRQLESLPPEKDYQAEPYFSLWSSLCHQGDVYLASYAALPHLVRIICANPEQVPPGLVQLVACIEIARGRGHGPKKLGEFALAYEAALARVPDAVAGLARKTWDHQFAQVALAAIAVSKGQIDLAELLLDLDSQTTKEILNQNLEG